MKICEQFFLAINLAMASLTAQASSIIPPPWPTLGQANLTTFQEWSFTTNTNPVTADAGGITGGFAPTLDSILPTLAPTPSAVMDGMVYATTHNGWQDDLGQPGIGKMTFYIPNWVDDFPDKFIRINITWFSSSAGIINRPFVTDVIGYDNPQNVVGTGHLLQDVWYNQSTSPFQLYQDWVIKPNPDWEKIVISPNTSFVTIQQVSIHTISTIPEPGTIALLSLGFAAVSAFYGSAVGWKKRGQRTLTVG